MLLLVAGHLLFVDVLKVEREARLTFYSFALVLVSILFFTRFAPVHSFSLGWVRGALGQRARVDSLVDVDQGLLANGASHVSFSDQLIVVVGWALTHGHLGLDELVRVSSVTFVAPFAESEIVTLLAVEAEVTFFNRFEAVGLITNEPALVALIFVSFSRLLDSLLF